jgi:hypothetical protein
VLASVVAGAIGRAAFGQAAFLTLPQLYGVGDPVLEGAVRGRYALGFLLMLLAGKVLATRTGPVTSMQTTRVGTILLGRRASRHHVLS